MMQVIMTLCLPLRFWLLRKKLRNRSTLALWSDGFFTFGWALTMGLGWHEVRNAWFGVSTRRNASTEEDVVHRLVTADAAKVCFFRPDCGAFTEHENSAISDDLYPRRHRDLGVQGRVHIHVRGPLRQDCQRPQARIICHRGVDPADIYRSSHRRADGV